MMTRDHWQQMIDSLRGVEYQFGIVAPYTSTYRIEFDRGLNDNEVASTEKRFGFRFPPELREFLQTALPKGPRFPDWRSGDPELLREWLDEPRQGVLFDVENNATWFDEWGLRPPDPREAFAPPSVRPSPTLSGANALRRRVSC